MSQKLKNVFFRESKAIHLVQNFKEFLKERYPEETTEGKRKAKLFVLLFARPGNSLSKNEIIPNLDYLHFHSKNDIDFYCVGYHKIDDVNEEKKVVVKVGKEDWGYNNLDFNKLRQYFEKETNWTYSGRTDMIISSYVFLEEELCINYGHSISFSLENALACNAIQSVEEFLTDLSNNANKGITSVFIDQYLSVGKNTLWNFVINLLPKHIRNLPEQLNTFMLQDLRKY